MVNTHELSYVATIKRKWKLYKTKTKEILTSFPPFNWIKFSLFFLSLFCRPKQFRVSEHSHTMFRLRLLYVVCFFFNISDVSQVKLFLYWNAQPNTKHNELSQIQNTVEVESPLFVCWYQCTVHTTMWYCCCTSYVYRNVNIAHLYV